MSDHDPIEILEEIIGKKDQLNPFKAMEKAKSFLAVLCFALGALPILCLGLQKIAGPLFVIGGIFVGIRVVHLLIRRSTRL